MEEILDVVFVGDLDRSFKAIDTTNGKVVWQTRLATSVQGFPISFSVDGRQYVAVSAGQALYSFALRQ